MYQHTRLQITDSFFFQKFKNFDYILLACILFLGFISLATMYSTDGGKVLFHTKSHFIKLVILLSMMLIFSFINIKFWFLLDIFYYSSYRIIGMDIFIWNKSSGSQRWIDLYLLILQPSELMKICIILCLSKIFS